MIINEPILLILIYLYVQNKRNLLYDHMVQSMNKIQDYAILYYMEMEMLIFTIYK